MAMAVAGARQWSCIVRDPFGQPVPAWRPSTGFAVGCEARTADRGRGDVRFFPRHPCSVFRSQRKGIKEGDDSGGPFVSETGENDGGKGRAGWLRGPRVVGPDLRVRPRALAGQRGREGELGQQLGARGVWASWAYFGHRPDKGRKVCAG